MATMAPVPGCSSTAPTCAYQGSALPSAAISFSFWLTAEYSAFIIGLLNVVTTCSPAVSISGSV